ncbi:MAG: endonuclease/exonuclease/phosphatase family protein [Planctomycetota bacterium]
MTSEAVDAPAPAPAPEPGPPPARPRRRWRRGFALAALLFVVGATGVTVTAIDPLYQRPEIPDHVTPDREDVALRVLSINMAHGRGTAFHQALTRRVHIEQNLDAIAELIRESQADVVAFQELDGPSTWSGGFDHLEFVRLRSGLDYAYHGFHVQRARPRIAYGTGVLSRFPIERSESRAFSMNAVDTKGYVRVRLQTPHGAVDVVSLHLDFKRDSEREGQLALLSEDLRARAEPAQRLIVAGDFNCTFDGDGGILREFAAALALTTDPDGAPTFPNRRPRRRIDYVFACAGLLHVRELPVPVEVSDHRPVLADLHLVD